MSSPFIAITPASTELIKRNFVWVAIMALGYCVLSLYQDQKGLYKEIQTIQQDVILKNTEAIIKNTEALKCIIQPVAIEPVKK